MRSELVGDHAYISTPQPKSRSHKMAKNAKGPPKPPKFMVFGVDRFGEYRAYIIVKFGVLPRPGI
jgi:hypothetical protein